MIFITKIEFKPDNVIEVTYVRDSISLKTVMVSEELLFMFLDIKKLTEVINDNDNDR